VRAEIAIAEHQRRTREGALAFRKPGDGDDIRLVQAGGLFQCEGDVFLKITGWGWYYLSTVLDDFSRFIVAWKLCATMRGDDVTATLDLTLAASGLDRITVAHRPRLLSDNGSSYISADLATWLDGKGMQHVRCAPYQTQGKIELWHQTLKNRILLENYYLPDDLEREVAAFVEHYNHARYHESLSNLTPADVYFGRGQTIPTERERIKRQTIQKRRLQHQLQAA
jgi:transposase InsO family protein